MSSYPERCPGLCIPEHPSLNSYLLMHIYIYIFTKPLQSHRSTTACDGTNSVVVIPTDAYTSGCGANAFVGGALKGDMTGPR